jgi:hypothetical protein
VVQAIGELLDNQYHIIALLEQRGPSAIYRGQNHQTGRPVVCLALARVGDDAAPRPIPALDGLTQSQYEAMPSLRRLSLDNALVYVCEHRDAESLDVWLARAPGHKLPPQAALLALLPVVKALRQLHAAGVAVALHSIAPRTINLAADGEIELNYRALFPQLAAGEGLAGASLAPSATLQAQLHAAGATLLALLGGRQPQAGSLAALQAALHALDPAPSPELQLALEGLLSPEPATRFSTADAALIALQQALGEQRCSICKQANPPTAIYCEQCGSRLPFAHPPNALLQALAAPAAAVEAPPVAAPTLAPAITPASAAASPHARHRASAAPGGQRAGSPLWRVLLPLLVCLLTTLIACVGLNRVLAFWRVAPTAVSTSALAHSPSVAETRSAPRPAPSAVAAHLRQEPSVVASATRSHPVVSASVRASSTATAKRPASTGTATATASPLPLPSNSATPQLLPSLRPLPEPTLRPNGPQLRFRAENYDDVNTCISVQIRGIATTGWSFSVDGLTFLDGRFDNAGNARLCELAPGQEVTITVFQAEGRPVRGGGGVPARGGVILVADWR